MPSHAFGYDATPRPSFSPNILTNPTIGTSNTAVVQSANGLNRKVIIHFPWDITKNGERIGVGDSGMASFDEGIVLNCGDTLELETFGPVYAIAENNPTVLNVYEVYP